MKYSESLIYRLLLPLWPACLALSIQTNAAIVPGSKDLGSIWFIGDSITQGNADGNPNGSPRKSLYDKLLTAGYTFTYTGNLTVNIDGLPTTGNSPANNLYQYHSGVSGAVIGTNWTGDRKGLTQELPAWWTSERLAVVKPNVILLMIGANDVDLEIDLPNAMTRLTSLINTIYNQPGVGNPTILLATITPNRNRASVPSRVTAFNAGIPGVVQAFQKLGKDIYLVDQFSDLDANFATAMMPDKLHPNSVGNDYIAQNWFNAIQRWLGGSKVNRGA